MDEWNKSNTCGRFNRVVWSKLAFPAFQISSGSVIMYLCFFNLILTENKGAWTYRQGKKQRAQSGWVAGAQVKSGDIFIFKNKLFLTT